MQQMTIFLVQSRNWQWNSVLWCFKQKTHTIFENMCIYWSRRVDCFLVFCFFFGGDGVYCKSTSFVEDVRKTAKSSHVKMLGGKKLMQHSFGNGCEEETHWCVRIGNETLVRIGRNIHSPTALTRIRQAFVVIFFRPHFKGVRFQTDDEKWKTIGDTSKNNINTLNNRIPFCRIKLLLFLFKPGRRNAKQTQLFSRLTRIFRVLHECLDGKEWIFVRIFWDFKGFWPVRIWSSSGSSKTIFRLTIYRYVPNTMSFTWAETGRTDVDYWVMTRSPVRVTGIVRVCCLFLHHLSPWRGFVENFYQRILVHLTRMQTFPVEKCRRTHCYEG